MEKKLNPFAVMVHPRRFMRSPYARRKGVHWWLAGIAGLNYLFTKSSFFALGYSLPLWLILLIDLVLAVPVGIVSFYLAAFLLQITGKIFRVKAKFHELYAAFAWSRVPVIFQLLIWAIFLGMFGTAAFTAQFANSSNASIVVPILMLIYLGLFVWELVILTHTVAEVQRTSAWFAIWNVLITYIVFFAINFLIDSVLVMSLDWKVVASSINIKG